MGHLRMDSKGWPYDSFDCLLSKMPDMIILKNDLPQTGDTGIFEVYG